MSRTWFRSDDHFGHQKVAVEHRGFPTTAHHDLALIDNHNALVSENDVVYFLGDLSAGGAEATRAALNKIRYMRGRKRLIAGNHDPIHPMNRQAHKWFPDYMEVFESVAPFGRVSVQGTRVLLSHFPYEGDRGEARYTQYRLRNEGHWLLHGHLHSELAQTSSREIHVGLDAWGYAPADSETISAMIESTLFGEREEWAA